MVVTCHPEGLGLALKQPATDTTMQPRAVENLTLEEAPVLLARSVIPAETTLAEVEVPTRSSWGGWGGAAVAILLKCLRGGVASVMMIYALNSGRGSALAMN